MFMQPLIHHSMQNKNEKQFAKIEQRVGMRLQKSTKQGQNVEMTLGDSGCGQYMESMGVVTGCSGCDQRVGPVYVVIECGQWVVDTS